MSESVTLARRLQCVLRDADAADAQAYNHHGRKGDEYSRACSEATNARRHALELARDLARSVIEHDPAQDQSE